MRAWPVALVLALLLLAVPASASAGGTLATQDVSRVMDGPVFAGERVFWATLPDDGRSAVDFHLARADGREHQRWVLKAPTGIFGFHDGFALAASSERVAAGLSIFGCYPSCKYQYYETLYAAMLTAPPGEAPAKFADACGPHSTHHYSGHDPAVDVSGAVVAYEPCSSQTVVRDFSAPPGTSTFENAGAPRIAGAFLALHEGTAPPQPPQSRALVLRRWREGTVVHRIEGDPTSYDVQEDGKLAFSRTNDGPPAVMWVAPGSALKHFVAPAPGGARSIRIARDRIAWEDAGGTHVRTVGGAHVAFSPTAEVDDFDGERLTWATQPCALLAIATWDLEGQAPSFPHEPCPIARPHSKILRTRYVQGVADGVRVKLTCPAEPALGCGGGLSLWGRDMRRRSPRKDRRLDLAAGEFRMRPGETKTFSMQYAKHRVCIAGRSGLRPLLEIRYGRVERHRMSVAGLTRALARCAA